MTVPEDSNAMTHKGQGVFCDAWLTKPVVFLLVKWFILGIATKLVTLYTDDRLMASPNESRETLQNPQSVTPGHKVQHRGEAWLWRRKEIEIWEYALLTLEWAKGVGVQCIVPYQKKILLRYPYRFRMCSNIKILQIVHGIIAKYSNQKSLYYFIITSGKVFYLLEGIRLSYILFYILHTGWVL